MTEQPKKVDVASGRASASSQAPPSIGSMASDFKHANGGVELVFAPVLFALFGLWLDRKFSTIPLFVISLTVLGFVGAALNVYYRYKAEIEAIEAEAVELRAQANSNLSKKRETPPQTRGSS